MTTTFMCIIGKQTITASLSPSERKRDFSDIISSCEITSGICEPISRIVITAPKSTIQSDKYWSDKSKAIDGTDGTNIYNTIVIGKTYMSLQLYGKIYNSYIVTDISSDDEVVTITLNSANYMNKYICPADMYTITTSIGSTGTYFILTSRIYPSIIYTTSEVTNITDNTTYDVYAHRNSTIPSSSAPLVFQIKYSTTGSVLTGIKINKGNGTVSSLMDVIGVSRGGPSNIISTKYSDKFNELVKLYKQNDNTYAIPYHTNTPTSVISNIPTSDTCMIADAESYYTNYSQTIDTIPQNSILSDIFFDATSSTEEIIEMVAAIEDGHTYYAQEFGRDGTELSNIVTYLALNNGLAKTSYTISMDNPRILGISTVDSPNAENTSMSQKVYIGNCSTTFSILGNASASTDMPSAKSLDDIKYKWCYSPNSSSDALPLYVGKVIARHNVIEAYRPQSAVSFSISELTKEPTTSATILENGAIGTITSTTPQHYFNTYADLNDILTNENNTYYTLVKNFSYNSGYRKHVYAYVYNNGSDISDGATCFELSRTGTENDYVSEYGPYWMPYDGFEVIRPYVYLTNDDTIPPLYVQNLYDKENNMVMKDMFVGAVTVSYPSGVSYYTYSNSKYTDTEQTIADIKSAVKNKTIENTYNITVSESPTYDELIGNKSTTEYYVDDTEYTGLITHKDQTSNDYYIAGYNDGELSFKLSQNEASIFKALELCHPTPYIDFHYGNSTSDYTSRIIESPSGTLNISGALLVNGVLDLYNGYNSSSDSSLPLILRQKDGTATQGTYSNILVKNASSQEVVLCGGYQTATQNGFRLGLYSRDASTFEHWTTILPSSIEHVFKNNADITIKNNSITYGNRPSSWTYTGGIQFKDSASRRGEMLETFYQPDGARGIYLNVNRSNSGESWGTSLGLYSDGNGNSWTSAPTPNNDSNDTNIATTAWVNTNKISKYTPSVISYFGQLYVNSSNCIMGAFNAIITDTGSYKIIEINMSVKVTAGSSDNWTFTRPSYLMNLFGASYTTITNVCEGIWHEIGTSGNIDYNHLGYGASTSTNISNDYIQVGRYYTTSGSWGGWQLSELVNDIIEIVGLKFIYY